MPSLDGTAGNSRERGRALRVVVAGLVVMLGLARPCAAAVVECASADVACLIAAINTANANGGANTIRLQPGTYTLRAPDNDTDGANGLPSITSPLTIVGAGAGHTIIEREATAPEFRLLHVAQTGLLKLEGLTARGGRLGGQFFFGGAGLLNRGTAIISQSALTDSADRESGGGGGGGIASFGRLVIAGSTISNNNSGGPGGGVLSRAGLTVVNSTISGNTGNVGGGLYIGEGMAIIIGSTIADNLATDGNGGGLFSTSAAVAIINSTLAGNRTGVAGTGGGLAVSGGGGIIVNATIANNSTLGGGDALFASSALALYNTIVSGPPALGEPACLGRATSLGNNLFTDPSCAVALLPDDLTGDPRLGDFTDDGTPGHGFLPLLRRSPAINAGDDAACLPTDQRGRRRAGKSCDIGAIEGTHP